MPYLLQSELSAELPPQFLLQALDDDQDGVADEAVWENVLASAQEAVDGTLGQAYPVPFAEPLPAVVKSATRAFVLETLYLRRGFAGDQNPWHGIAKEWRKKLDAIAAGTQPLTPTAAKVNDTVTAITEPSKTHLRSGGLLA